MYFVVKINETSEKTWKDRPVYIGFIDSGYSAITDASLFFLWILLLWGNIHNIKFTILTTFKYTA